MSQVNLHDILEQLHACSSFGLTCIFELSCHFAAKAAAVMNFLACKDFAYFDAHR